jgi:hypothetical protein
MFSRRKGQDPAAVRDEQLQRFVDEAETFRGYDPGEVPGMRVHTSSGEGIYLCIHGAFLIEQRTLGEARPAPIDQGEFVVTTTRAVFMGARQVRQWPWSRLIRIEHGGAPPWSSIVVSNRKRTFGVLYDNEHRDEIRFSIDLAAATAQGTRDELIRRLTNELTAARAATA